MKTEILKINEENIKRTAEILLNGGICIYPTETSYGIGCIATNEEAIKRVRKIKKMDNEKRISIIVYDVEMANDYAILNDKLKFILNKYMPCALTVISNKKDVIPNILNKDGIGFRIPSNDIARKLVFYTNIPVTATSANITKHPQLYKIKDVIHFFDGEVDVILDAGNLIEEKPTTIIDFKERDPKIIREGSVNPSLILSQLK